VCLRFAAGDRSWALDCTHDVFVKLMDAQDRVREREDPGGWLYRVAVNTCFMALRSHRRRDRLRSLLGRRPPDVEPPPENRMRAAQTLSRLEGALRALPTKQRVIMVLVHLEEKSQQEVVQLLGLSKGQVSKLHSRAFAKLAEGDWDIGDD
jgi:RNA polymerase sigma-70 factor (ECF subfamily)